MQAGTQPPVNDKWIEKFLQHLATDRGASTYTQRNYRQAMRSFTTGTGRSGSSRPHGSNCNGMTFAPICGSWDDII